MNKQSYEIEGVNLNGIEESFFDGFKPKEIVNSVKRNEDRFKFTNRFILDYLELRKGSGATIPEINEATGLDRNTISKHLTYLVATRQAYKLNDAAGVYHKNGRIVHYKNMERKLFEKRLYTFFQLEGLDGQDYIYVQEKEIGKLKTATVKGGIMIEKDGLKQFINELSLFEKELGERKR
jgi:hypothetical protein